MVDFAFNDVYSWALCEGSGVTEMNNKPGESLAAGDGDENVAVQGQGKSKHILKKAGWQLYSLIGFQPLVIFG